MGGQHDITWLGSSTLTLWLLVLFFAVTSYWAYSATYLLDRWVGAAAGGERSPRAWEAGWGSPAATTSGSARGAP
jgi:hypothetical protein